MDVDDESTGVELEGLPSNPQAPDVIHVFPATDQAFGDQHGDDYKDYVRQIIYDTNDALEDEFENEKPTPHIVITTLDQGAFDGGSEPRNITTVARAGSGE